MAAKKTTPIDFEQALGELETVVEQLEKGELSLEDSLTRFERGVELTRLCQITLRQAEQKVDKLLERDGQVSVAPLDGQD